MGLGSLFLIVLVGGVVYSIASAPPPAPRVPGSKREAVAAKPEPKPMPEPNWVLVEDTDEATRKPITGAATISKNAVNFDFPYAGEQHASLIVRDHPRHGRDVYMRLDRGQFLCHISDCSIKVQYDAGPLVTFSATESADGSTNIVFIRDAGTFLAKLKTAKTVSIYALFFRQGEKRFEFDVTGYPPSK